MNKKAFLLSILILTLFGGVWACHTSRKEEVRTLINFQHLNSLTEPVTLNGKPALIIHVYSNYPEYKWVDAAEEGMTCVDDAARAAVVYLRYHEITGDITVLEKAKGLLNFVCYMQTEDGEFYNFLNRNMTINKEGRTSRKSFGSWAARGYWALGHGYKVFRGVDSAYAQLLKTAFLRCQGPLQRLLANYLQYVEIEGRNYPRWLIYETASDATSELLLGLVAYLQAEDDARLKDYARKLAEGLLAMQLNHKEIFSGAFLSWPNHWHAWGNAQTQALASLGLLLTDLRFISAAEREARQFYGHLLVRGLLREFQLNNPAQQTEFPQLAYDIRCMAVGLIRLYEATQNQDYAKLAGLVASWFFGNNAAKTPMYHPETGRCYDGLEDSVRVNLNSGAESTLEALYAIIETATNPVSCRYINYKIKQFGSWEEKPVGNKKDYRTFKNDKASEITIIMDTQVEIKED